jgi:uncharacterized repeat protein (TIGR04044 family)
LVSDLATSAAGLNPGLTATEAAGINCATAAQRYAQQRSPNQPMTVRLMLSVVVRDENDSPPKTPKPDHSMPTVEKELNKKGDFLVDYEEKVFPDIKADPGEKALVTFHTVAFEGSISIVNTLTATRLQRKGYETSILLYGPGVTMGFQRGFPTLGDEAFPGHLFVNQRLETFMKEGGKVYGCRFSTQALYGQTEKAFIQGIRPISPLDVLDIILMHKKAGAVIIDSWTV